MGLYNSYACAEGMIYMMLVYGDVEIFSTNFQKNECSDGVILKALDLRFTNFTSVIFQNNTYDSTEGAVVIHPKNSDQHRMPIMTNVTFIANINSDVSGGGALHVLTSDSP